MEVDEQIRRKVYEALSCAAEAQVRAREARESLREVLSLLAVVSTDAATDIGPDPDIPATEFEFVEKKEDT